MRSSSLLAVILLYLLSAFAPAQTFSLDHNRDTVTSLAGRWRLHLGDDPTPVTQHSAEPHFSDAPFDDSSWMLASPTRPLPTSGHRYYAGFAWYRAQLELPSDQGRSYSLSVPPGANYEVFADGQRLGGCGFLPPHRAIQFFCPAKVFPLPDASPGRPLHVAIRVWAIHVHQSFAERGFYVGDTSAINRISTGLHDSDQQVFIQEYVMIALEVLAAFIAWLLFSFRRSDREYLWFGVFVAMLAMSRLLQVILQSFGIPALVYLLSLSVFSCAAQIAQLIFFFVLFRTRRTRFFYVAVGCQIIIAVYTLVSAEIGLDYAALHNHPLLVVLGATAICQLVTVVCVMNLVIRRALKGDFDARILLLPAMLLTGSSLGEILIGLVRSLGWIHLAVNVNESLVHKPFPVRAEVLFEIIFLVAALFTLMWRFSRSCSLEDKTQRDQQTAQSVQQLLSPAGLPVVPGFQLESAYLPLQELGGDFFHLAPVSDGSLLVVLGNVSGKGITAAMTVGVLIGALRDHRERSPSALLAHLNQVLYGKVREAVTCTAAMFAQDGSVILASAGQLAPYRNGEACVVDAGAPLGLTPDAGHAETQFKLEPGDVLTFVSDGVVHATGKDGKVFGDERTRAISRLPAASIAATARSFGQQDDITVLRIAYAGAAAPATRGA